MINSRRPWLGWPLSIKTFRTSSIAPMSFLPPSLSLAQLISLPLSVTPISNKLYVLFSSSYVWFQVIITNTYENSVLLPHSQLCPLSLVLPLLFLPCKFLLQSFFRLWRSLTLFIQSSRCRRQLKAVKLISSTFLVRPEYLDSVHQCIGFLWFQMFSISVARNNKFFLNIF